MAHFQLDEASLLKQRLGDLRDLRAKERATSLHNLKIRFAKLKELRNEVSLIEKEKAQKEINVINQLQEENNLIQNQIEEAKLQVKSIIDNTTKCKVDIAGTERTLIETEESIRKARSRFGNLKDAQREMEEELKNKWLGLMKAYNYFKQRLQCSLEIEDPHKMSGVLYLFSVTKSDKYYVRLTLKDGHWSFSELTPELPQQAELALKLAATNDVSGFLACLVNLFQERRHLTEKGY